MSKQKDKNKRPKQKIFDIFKNNFIMLGKVAKHTPEYIFLMIAEGVVWGFLNSAVAVFNYTLLNAIDEKGDFGYAVKIILFMAAFDILAYAFERWYWCVQNPIIKQKLHKLLIESVCLIRLTGIYKIRTSALSGIGI